MSYKGSQDIKDSMIVSHLDSIDSNAPPPLQRELRLCVGHFQETWLNAVTYESILAFVKCVREGGFYVFIRNLQSPSRQHVITALCKENTGRGIYGSVGV